MMMIPVKLWHIICPERKWSEMLIVYGSMCVRNIMQMVVRCQFGSGTVLSRSKFHTFVSAVMIDG